MQVKATEQNYPAQDSVEAWVHAFIVGTELTEKLRPGPCPAAWHATQLTAPERPGRPKELRVVPTSPRLNAPQRSAIARAKLIHTFFHHELQAAELMGWALLKFKEAPLAWRKGLLAILLDEVRHMQLYADYLSAAGFEIGCFPVRDWFWQRVPSCETPLQFVALMSLGLEAANLEHAARFAGEFRAAGDELGAELQERIEREEIAHVAFGRHWFEHFTGGLCFERWQAELPPPLTPLLMRGTPLNRSARERAGLPADFLDELTRWQPATPGS